MERQRHEMVLENTHHSGAEDWYCPTCGRRMTITWRPWKKIILEPGDIYASHSASKGGLRVGALQITQDTLDNEDGPPSATEPFNEDPYLAPWQRWLDKVDSDDLWNRDD
jgi:hypothetical protein